MSQSPIEPLCKKAYGLW